MFITISVVIYYMFDRTSLIGNQIMFTDNEVGNNISIIIRVSKYWYPCNSLSIYSIPYSNHDSIEQHVISAHKIVTSVKIVQW